MSSAFVDILGSIDQKLVLQRRRQEEGEGKGEGKGEGEGEGEGEKRWTEVGSLATVLPGAHSEPTSFEEWFATTAQPSLPWGTYWPLTLGRGGGGGECRCQSLAVTPACMDNVLSLSLHFSSCEYLHGRF